MATENKTAVDWLVKEISAILGPIATKPMQDLLLVDAIKKAKELEKQQHETTFNKGFELSSYSHDCIHGGDEYWDEEPKKFDEYYSQAYGGGNE